MPDEALQSYAYHVVRYLPNLVRDEWVNIGVLLLDPVSGRLRQRWLEESADFARLRRMHPAADEELLLRLPAEFYRQFAGAGSAAGAILEKFDQTLSNAVQLSPRKGSAGKRSRCGTRTPFPRAGRAASGNTARRKRNPNTKRCARAGCGLFQE